MFIGIDVGGTKIAAVLLDAQGRERARHRVATPASHDGMLEALARLVAGLEEGAGTFGLPVGVGLPGRVDPAAGTVTAVNLPWLAGRPFADDLAARLGRPIAIANDANCFALSEAVDGAGAGAGVVFGVILGTGVGGGIVVDGRCLTGAHGIAGEWGHTPLPWRSAADGPPLPCACGRMGCIETIISGAGLLTLHRRLGGNKDCARTIAECAGYDPIARATLDLYFSALARALACALNFLDPDAIVLGGGLSELPGILDNISRMWRGIALVDTPRTHLARHYMVPTAG